MHVFEGRSSRVRACSWHVSRCTRAVKLVVDKGRNVLAASIRQLRPRGIGIVPVSSLGRVAPPHAGLGDRGHQSAHVADGLRLTSIRIRLLLPCSLRLAPILTVCTVVDFLGDWLKSGSQIVSRRCLLEMRRSFRRRLVLRCRLLRGARACSR